MNVKLGPDDVASTYVYPLPEETRRSRRSCTFLGYRNMLEKVAERYHTTPATVVALNGPDRLIGPGQTLRCPMSCRRRAIMRAVAESRRG